MQDNVIHKSCTDQAHYSSPDKFSAALDNKVNNAQFIYRQISSTCDKHCQLTQAICSRLIKTNLFWVAVEVEIHHHLPGMIATDCAAEPQDLTGQHPPHQANGVGRLENKWKLECVQECL